MGGDTSDMASAREEAPNDKCTTDDTTKQPQAHRLKLTDTACAICMEEYMVDDLVVYASAATAGGCPHMFHKDCFVDYLVAYRGDDGYGSPCPTCRQPFCSPTMFHDGNKEGDSKKPYAPRRSSGPAGEVSRRDASSRQSDGVPDATESTLSDSVVSLSASVADGESQQASSSHNAGDV